MLCHILYDTIVFAGLPTNIPPIQILIETKRCLEQYRGDTIKSTLGVGISISLRCLNIALAHHRTLSMRERMSWALASSVAAAAACYLVSASDSLGGVHSAPVS
jgi:hypothetical protein